MKLRNKKTRKIKELACLQMIEKRKGEYDVFNAYKSLNQLNEDWEDYKPAEPLIKDEKIRNAVRAWAEAFGVTKVYVYCIGDGKEYIELFAQDNGVTDGRIRISIPTLDGVWIGEEYIITELCGEEQECES